MPGRGDLGHGLALRGAQVIGLPQPLDTVDEEIGSVIGAQILDQGADRGPGAPQWLPF